MSNPVAVREEPAAGEPAVSFLCSAYRTEAYLPGTIASVLAQTRPDWQLVVVDNGMSDAIRDIVLAHDDPRIVLLRQENDGVEGGVSAAATAATGRYVAVLHSDDQVAPEYVERVAGILDAHPEVDVLGCDAVVVDDATGRPRSPSWFAFAGAPRRPRFEHSVTLAEFIDEATLYYSSAVRREAWLAAGGYRKDAGMADAALWIRLLRQGADVRVIPDKLGRYLWRAESLSRNPDSLSTYQALQVRAWVEGAEGSTDPAVHEALARRLRRLRYHEALGRARSALLRGDSAGARAEAADALAQQVRPRSLAAAAATRIPAPLVVRAWALKQAVASRLRGLTRSVARHDR
ncbi:glycosyltransferase family 2 protein [Actinomycetospora straminea]|uniref:Glycosyltransferase 2-like domain-containing protein n=1 Tax=Actinomycetospora straminea TaxID=663607 RepID=A0ABP9E122_9PSEU|nr:glycosyltransferase [Actinomycetospora straminea]MDD7931124.1 glycosyltransferase [Actinomycetospora straminea]